jgi:hypothetical protein
MAQAFAFTHLLSSKAIKVGILQGHTREQG